MELPTEGTADKPELQSPEETAGILGRTFFWWINPILGDGNRKILVAEDLPNVDRALTSETLREKILLAWSDRGAVSI